MNLYLDKRVVTARELYHILQETARVLQVCTGIEPDYKEILFATELRNRVVNDVVSLLYNGGYPVFITETSSIGGEEVESLKIHRKLAKLFADSEYEVIIDAIDEILCQPNSNER